MTQAWQSVANFFINIFSRPDLSSVIDILLVSFIVYQLLLITEQTRARQVLQGLGMLLVASWLTTLFNLHTVNWLISQILNAGAVVLVILFQPELRRALEKIGGSLAYDVNNPGNEDATKNRIQFAIRETVLACMDLSARRVGLLMVFEHKTLLNDIISTGTPIDATLSAPLLENIFEPKTPLHDGAVIVRDFRIVAASCLLPLTAAAVNRELGTRHRAAIGVTENSDALALVVSEETGTISLVHEGRITRNYTAETLTQALQRYFDAPVSPALGLRTLIQKRRRRSDDRKGS